MLCLYDKNETKSFMLLHKLDFDPLGEHTEPHMIVYMYTFPEYRRKGFVNELLQYVKQNLETTAAINGEISDRVFNTAGFKNRGIIKRYPWKNECNIKLLI